MDQAAPITWLIGQINEIVTSGANAAAGAIASAVTPLASIGFGIYMILIVFNYLRGAETEPVTDLGLRFAGFAVVIGLGLNMSNYSNYVIPVITGLGSDLANAISGGNATAGALDQLALHYFDILQKGYTKANSPIFPGNIGPLILYFIKFICIMLGLVPFLVAAALALIVADVGSVIVAMLGPMYFAFLLFPATRQYFSAWVNTALSYALIPLVVALVATISVGISKVMLGGNQLHETSLMSVFLATMGNLVLLFLLKQVSSIASSLSAGGINAGMPGGVGALAGGIRSSGVGTLREIRGIQRMQKNWQKNKNSKKPEGGSISGNRKAG